MGQGVSGAVRRRVRRLRTWARSGAATGGPGRKAKPTSDVVNLAANPGFRAVAARKRVDIGGDTVDVDVFDQPFAAGGVYVHVHNVGYAAPLPGGDGVAGILVRGVDGDNDTHVAPGGRNAKNTFRLGMRPGRTYTAEVSVYLARPLTGHLSRYALRIVVGIMEGSTIQWSFAQSHAARNEQGDHRISVTFTVPDTATSAGHGEVYWHSLVLTESAAPVGYFDGDTPDDDLYRYAWTGIPNASPSRRTRRPVAELARIEGGAAAIAEHAVRCAADGRTVEVDALIAAAEAGERAALRLRTDAIRLAATGDVAAATSVLRKAAQGKDPRGDAAFDLGRLLQAHGRGNAAEPWLRSALAARPESSLRAYRLAAVLEQSGRRADSDTVARQGIALDRELPFDPDVLVAVEAKAVGARREVGVFLAEHLDQIRTQTRQRLDAAVDNHRTPIFVYWGQGFASAPPVVRRCRAALREQNPTADVHELTDDMIPYWVELPGDLVAAVGDNRTHMSDLLRLALLEKYGGIWVDATCLVTQPLLPQLDRLLSTSDIFAFNYAGAFISSWFLACRPGCYAVHLWRAAMFLWWEKRGELIDYFLLHHFFEMLCNLDDEFREAWAKGTRASARPPHELQQAMLAPYDPDAFATMLAGSFVHKLRHKIDLRHVRSDSYLAHLVRGDRG
jgi:tetratricopeptide (TPR) repeat protein